MMRYKTEKPIVFLGDIHGEWHELGRRLKRYQITNSTIIALGDIGMGFDRKTKELRNMKWLSDRLWKFNNDIMFIRGNHDNREYFLRSKPVLEPVSNIVFVEDYSVLEGSGELILMVGGATSIDQKWRVEGSSWWRNENVAPLLLKTKEDLLSGKLPITILASHEAAYTPLVFNDNSFNEEVKRNIRADRLILREVLDSCKGIKKAYNGHLHESYKHSYNGIEFHSLGIMELKGL